MILVAAFLSAIVLWLIGAAIDHYEQAKMDREFWDHWHEERRPGKGSGY